MIDKGTIRIGGESIIISKETIRINSETLWSDNQAQIIKSFKTEATPGVAILFRGLRESQG